MFVQWLAVDPNPTTPGDSYDQLESLDFDGRTFCSAIRLPGDGLPTVRTDPRSSTSTTAATKTRSLVDRTVQLVVSWDRQCGGVTTACVVLPRIKVGSYRRHVEWDSARTVRDINERTRWRTHRRNGSWPPSRPAH